MLQEICRFISYKFQVTDFRSKQDSIRAAFHSRKRAGTCPALNFRSFSAFARLRTEGYLHIRVFLPPVRGCGRDRHRPGHIEGHQSFLRDRGDFRIAALPGDRLLRFRRQRTCRQLICKGLRGDSRPRDRFPIRIPDNNGSRFRQQLQSERRAVHPLHLYIRQGSQHQSYQNRHKLSWSGYR